ncbi:transglutaminase-like domain-containing protein [Glycomyces scopariae]
MTTQDELAYYASPGPLTTAEPALTSLPAEVPALLEAVQGLLVHEPGHPDRPTGHLRSTAEILDHLAPTGPLTQARQPDQRLIGCCRHFTLLPVAALRAHGIPARARCGFATYFMPGWHIDHWVVEYWSAGRWHLADAQLDPALRDRLGIAFGSAFNPADVPRDSPTTPNADPRAFAVAGETWLRCRAGDLDPARCGFPGDGTHGLWWIAGNLIRDVAALSKMELLPWDLWGAMPGPADPIADDLATLLDHLATITADPETAAKSRDTYPDAALKVPAKVFNHLRQAEEPVFTR